MAWYYNTYTTTGQGKTNLYIRIWKVKITGRTQGRDVPIEFEKKIVDGVKEFPTKPGRKVNIPSVLVYNKINSLKYKVISEIFKRATKEKIDKVLF